MFPPCKQKKRQIYLRRTVGEWEEFGTIWTLISISGHVSPTLQFPEGAASPSGWAWGQAGIDRIYFAKICFWFFRYKALSEFYLCELECFLLWFFCITVLCRSWQTMAHDQLQPVFWLWTAQELRIVFTCLNGWKKSKEYYFVTCENDKKFKFQCP